MQMKTARGVAPAGCSTCALFRLARTGAAVPTAAETAGATAYLRVVFFLAAAFLARAGSFGRVFPKEPW
jgi:hypothetical protein